MKFDTHDVTDEAFSLTLRSECPGDMVKLVFLLASLKIAAGMEFDSPNSGSTNPKKPEPAKVGA